MKKMAIILGALVVSMTSSAIATQIPDNSSFSQIHTKPVINNEYQQPMANPIDRENLLIQKRDKLNTNKIPMSAKTRNKICVFSAAGVFGAITYFLALNPLTASVAIFTGFVTFVWFAGGMGWLDRR